MLNKTFRNIQEYSFTLFFTHSHRWSESCRIQSLFQEHWVPFFAKQHAHSFTSRCNLLQWVHLIGDRGLCTNNILSSGSNPIPQRCKTAMQLAVPLCHPYTITVNMYFSLPITQFRITQLHSNRNRFLWSIPFRSVVHTYCRLKTCYPD